LRWPGNPVCAPRDVDTLCQVQDLLPTLAEFSGVAQVPGGLDGQSLVPLLRGDHHALADRLVVINYSRMPQFTVTYTTGNPAIPARDGAAVLWKHWRWLENRELYDLRADPHQDHDVASQHPEVVARMRQHLNQWWDGVKDQVMIPQRVVIGSDRENPLLLTACEWLDVFVDQQRQIRQAERKNGVWHLMVDRAGLYELELRRWPRECAQPLNAAVPEQQVTDGRFVAGSALPIARARLRIQDYEATADPTDDLQSVRFTAQLAAGPAELQTWMLDESGQTLCGAYYVYVRRQ
jgi:hypothetical protein